MHKHFLELAETDSQMGSDESEPAPSDVGVTHPAREAGLEDNPYLLEQLGSLILLPAAFDDSTE